MVGSSVEYIDEEVEVGTAGESGDEVKRTSWAFAFINKMALPLLALGFVALYLDSVLGQIQFDNLYYPLFVLGALAILTVSVVLTELRDVYRLKREYSVPLWTKLEEALREWDVSIALLMASIAYVAVIPLLGFFPATIVAVPTIMVMSGFSNWKAIVVTTVVLNVLIYILFVELSSMQLPKGLLSL